MLADVDSQKFRWVQVADFAIGLFAIAFVASCREARTGESGRAPYGRNLPEPSGFFRVFADVRVKATGEIVEIGYVASCGAITQNWSYTTSSAFFGMAPHIMLVPTNSGELIGVRTPDVCDADLWWGHEDKVDTSLSSDSFLPVLMWYPDVNDIGFAIGYLSDKAYESPYAKIELLSSGIAKASLEEWRAWLEKSEAEFEPVGALPGPWGHQKVAYTGSSRAHEKYLRSINGGRNALTYLCHAMGLLEVPAEGRDDVLRMLPDNGQEWVSSSEVDQEFARPFRALLESLDFEGTSFTSHQRDYREFGARKSQGGGAFFRGGQYESDGYHDVWPIVPFQPDEIDPSTKEVQSWKHEWLREDAWNGFAVCGNDSPSVDALTAYAAGRSDSLRVDYSENGHPYSRYAGQLKPEALFLDGQIVFSTQERYVDPYYFTGRRVPIFNRSGQVIPDCCVR
ncbi:hypothetical protein K1X12_13805 [Hyphomonas sp. WL0036]|uniref:hypothetical protein n=1 Tax=Hyphomonas sediminis TaxID=2866160 RepID=UPI001C7F765B|nr:hypothetical protein [Hyphomonas sediminis]MBY9067981.1 hypothetical protein [Hyphomonas sediminis]